MQILSAKYIITDKKILLDKAIAFHSVIVAIDGLEALQKRYPEAKVTKLSPTSVITAGLINIHTHLEFSNNKTTLNYGNFIEWLNSVIKHREVLVGQCQDEDMLRASEAMLKSGVSTIGAISSYAYDLVACEQTKQRVVFFNEIIGSREDMMDALFADFMHRLSDAQAKMSARLIPAVAIHSPYSVHPKLIERVLEVAREQNLIVSTHFMESVAEREWLESSTGDFKSFFEQFLGQSSALTTPKEFLEHFDDGAILTHCTQIDEELIHFIAKHKHTITHCPRSNRLLNAKRLPIEKLDAINLTLGTDGLSSNYNLNIFDELRTALFMHTDGDVNALAKKLFESVTSNPARALKLKLGSIEVGYRADIAVFELPEILEDKEALYVQLILHTTHAKSVFIEGEESF